MTPGIGSSLLFSKSCTGYPFKQYRKVAYINSTGICNLNCEYCFTNNNKKPISIAKSDKAIVAMCHLEVLNKKLEYYAKNIFPSTNKKLNLVLDDFNNAVHSPSTTQFIDSVRSRYSEEVDQRKFSSKTINDKTTNQNYCVATSDDLFCQAGSLYFKINIDGDVMPCNKLGYGSKIRLGNLKEAKLGFIPQLVPCARLEGPGCLVNWDRRYPLI